MAKSLNTQQYLVPDLAQAQGFLETLDAGAVFTFQTFDDNAVRKNFRLAKVLHGTLTEHQAELIKLQQQGAGVFVMVNRGDGVVHPGNKTCRCAASVVAVRALFVDLDGAPIEPARQAFKPDIVVESSPGRWHAYWLTNDCPLEEFTLLQKQIAKLFSGDPKVCDLPRVMRVPGFWHQKQEPFLTKLIGWEALT